MAAAEDHCWLPHHDTEQGDEGPGPWPSGSFSSGLHFDITRLTLRDFQNGMAFPHFMVPRFSIFTEI